ncbi:hypothetical protein G6514_008440 [Epicoccum nigrum]|nr:hypothetical protein G6514_008440 [Epicoccum nigrum]
MLARNSEVDDATASVLSVQEQFSDKFGFGWVPLNDQEWTADFKTKVSQAIGERAEVKFEKISKSMWGYPTWIDQDKAARKMRDMEKAGIMYAGTESYHHMCRFQSGCFFNHPALKPYKYYWRVEPSIRFTCRIPYDPFLAMSQHKKVYGYNIALWEKGETVPSLFRKLSEYKSQLQYPITGLWTAMMAPSYMIWPFMRLMSLIRNRDENGDLWNVSFLEQL